jgi:hypothetical protein
VGKLIHFDLLREPIFQIIRPFGPPPVVGENGLLSWLTAQNKSAKAKMDAGNCSFFPWVCGEPLAFTYKTVLTSDKGWNPTILSRAHKLGVKLPCKVPYHISTKSGSWYTDSNEAVRDETAWEHVNSK